MLAPVRTEHAEALPLGRLGLAGIEGHEVESFRSFLCGHHGRCQLQRVGCADRMSLDESLRVAWWD